MRPKQRALAGMTVETPEDAKSQPGKLQIWVSRLSLLQEGTWMPLTYFMKLLLILLPVSQALLLKEVRMVLVVLILQQ